MIAQRRSAETHERQAVPTGLRYLIAFSAAALGAGLGRAVTTTYLPVLLHDVRDAPGLIGTVMLVNAAAGFGVPLLVGLWSDRLREDGRGRRLPFVTAGGLLTAGGLAAVALGSGTSYLVLAASGAVVYIGLNVITTAHRALIPDCFAATGRARATSAQELAMLLGGMLGIAAGGSLTAVGNWAPFALAGLLVPLLAAPTLLRVREPEAPRPEGGEKHALAYYVRAARRPGVRSFLGAQVLWVMGYAAMPVFFIIYAERKLGLDAPVASLWLAGFGVATGAAMLAAGRVRDPGRYKPLLTLGVALMGGGFLAIPLAPVDAAAAFALLAAAIGFGLISTLGFAFFTSYIPPGEAGGYTAMYFSVRAIASAVALPAVGWTIAVTDSYRTLFFLGGAATLAALIPLARVGPRTGGGTRLARRIQALPTPGWSDRWVGPLAWAYAAILALAVLLPVTALQSWDEAAFGAINSLGPGPDLLWDTLNPHTRNYILLGGVAVVAAAVTRRRPVLGVLILVLLADVVSWVLLESVYALYDRPRPEEVLDHSTIVLHGTWAHIESFPSGHMALTTALASAAWLAFPQLRRPLLAYVLLVAFTRVLFGAHFPLDTVAGIALGYASARAVFAVLVRIGVLEGDRPDPSTESGLEPPAPLPGTA